MDWLEVMFMKRALFLAFLFGASFTMDAAESPSAVFTREIRPLLDRVLPLSEAAEAHRLIASNAVNGNLVLKP